MQVVAQNLNDILAGLQPLTVDWQDDISRRVIAEIEAMPVTSSHWNTQQIPFAGQMSPN